jgi:cardiolipin synthase
MLPDTPANLALISTFWAVMPHVFLIVGVLLGLAVLVQLVRQRRAPQATIAWALAILLIPYVGIPLYLLIGGRKLRRIMNRKETIYLPGDVTTVDEPVHTLDRLLRGYNLPGATRGNRVTSTPAAKTPLTL